MRGSKSLLRSNDELFMNCLQQTALPSPPILPINESIKIRKSCERDRYFKTSTAYLKIKKVIDNDNANAFYYA
jgi:hypothetical protein